jgi:hypothetical protein
MDGNLGELATFLVFKLRGRIPPELSCFSYLFTAVCFGFRFTVFAFRGDCNGLVMFLWSVFADEHGRLPPLLPW